MVSHTCLGLRWGLMYQENRGGDSMDEDKFYKLYHELQIILAVQAGALLLISIGLLIR